LDGIGQKHTSSRKYVIIELTGEELVFKISENLPLEEAGAMLYGCLDYLSNLMGLYEDMDKTMVQ